MSATRRNGGPRGLAGALAAMALGAMPAVAAPPPELTRLPIPGEVAAAALLPAGGVAVASVTPDGEVGLWRVVRDAEGPRLQPLRAALGGLLAEGSDDDDGDASERLVLTASGADGALLLAAPGRLWRIPASGAPERVPVEAGFTLVPASESSSRIAAPLPDGAPLVLARTGELLLADPATGAPRVRVRLPVDARQQVWGLELRSPVVRRLQTPVAGTVAVVGPHAMGERRLRTLLVDGEGTVTEAWSLLPPGERLTSSRLLDVDGALVLAATSARESLFAKQRVRLYRLEADRTRRGRDPLFSVELDVRHWFEPGIALRDLDGDGRSELVLVEPRGLGGREMTVSSYAPLGGGRFATSPRKAQLPEGTALWAYDGDVDGDGLRDLLRLTDGTLSLHRGLSGGKAPAVTAAAAWAVEAGGEERRTVSIGVSTNGTTSASASDGPPPSERRDRRRDRTGDPEEDAAGDVEESLANVDIGPSRLATVDLDRDGRAEVLLWRTVGNGGSELTVVWQRVR